jgi:hypothetical protein
LCFTELRYAEILGITLGENNVIVHVWREREREGSYCQKEKNGCIEDNLPWSYGEREREREREVSLLPEAVFRTTHLAEPR